MIELYSVSELRLASAVRGGIIMPTTKAGQKAVNKYMKTNYDRVNLVLPKGRKADLSAHAQNGGESLNAFINRAVNETVERDRGRGE